MKELFGDILSMQDVKGVMLFSLEGDIVFKEFVSPPSKELSIAKWIPIIQSLKDVREADFVFVMNPTRMSQVRDCTAAGAKMPQKSTDFYPKVVSGLVALPIGPKERL